MDTAELQVQIGQLRAARIEIALATHAQTKLEAQRLATRIEVEREYREQPDAETAKKRSEKSIEDLARGDARVTDIMVSQARQAETLAIKSAEAEALKYSVQLGIAALATVGAAV